MPTMKYMYQRLITDELLGAKGTTITTKALIQDHIFLSNITGPGTGKCPLLGLVEMEGGLSLLLDAEVIMDAGQPSLSLLLDRQLEVGNGCRLGHQLALEIVADRAHDGRCGQHQIARETRT